MSKKPMPETTESFDWDLPTWVANELADRDTPYTEKELDLLVDGTVEGICDTVAWQNLVAQVGEEESRRILRTRIIMRDERAQKLPRH